MSLPAPSPLPAPTLDDRPSRWERWRASGAFRSLEDAAAQIGIGFGVAGLLIALLTR